MLPLLFLPQFLHYPGMPTNLWRNTVTQLFQEHKIMYNLPNISCSHIFFRFKSLSRRSLNDIISASLIHLSLNIFSISSTLAKGRQKRTSLAIERNLTDSRLIVLLSPPRSNLPVSQFYYRFAILQGWSVKLTWQLVFQIKTQFWAMYLARSYTTVTTGKQIVVHLEICGKRIVVHNCLPDRPPRKRKIE